MNRRLGPALVVLLVVVTFAGTLGHDFVYDDGPRVRDNPALDHLLPLGRFFLDPSSNAAEPSLVEYRPLPTLSLAVSRALTGSSPASYRVGNLLLHVLACLLLFFFGLELQRGVDGVARPTHRAVALAAAAFLAVHPVAGIVVNYVAARDLAMMQVLLLATLWSYARMRRLGETRRGWAACLGLYLACLLCKKNAVGLPLVVLAYELALGGPAARWWPALRRALPFAAVLGGLLAFERLAFPGVLLGNVHSSVRTAPWDYLATQLDLHWSRYLWQFLWPYGIRMHPEVTLGSLSSWRAWVGLVLVGGSLTWACQRRARSPLPAFCVAAYWILVAPTSSVLPLKWAAVDYRVYPSAPFMMLLIAHQGRRLGGRGQALVLGFVLAHLGACSLSLNSTWRDARSMWSHSVRLGGDSSAWYGLAQVTEDPAARRRLLEAVLARDPDHVLAGFLLAATLADSGQAEQAEAAARWALAVDPERPRSYFLLADVLRRAGRPAASLAAAREAVRRAPGVPHYLYLLAEQAQVLGDHQAALGPLLEIERRAPGFRRTRVRLALLALAAGRPAQATQLLRDHLEVHPDDREAAALLASGGPGAAPDG